MEALVAKEAKACGATLSYSEALQDARHGLTLKWSAHARADELKARLDRYTFHHEQVDNSAGKNLARQRLGRGHNPWPPSERQDR
jgi:hypothetical protein